MNSHGKDIKIFTLNSNKAVAHGIADCLGIPLGKSDCATFSDGEIAVSLHESVRGSDCFIVQSTCSPVNDNLIPLGRHMPVDKTPFDFRTAKTIGQDIEAENGQLLTGNGYDHNFVLNRPCLDTPAAELASPVTCIAMQVYTTAPGLQLYTGNFLNGVAGKGGVRYPKRGGFLPTLRR